ncbi:MAG: hypothetical protein LBI28_04150 [Treponema sp.]|jgi:hypothetical protein|nr:hypothetical protein [Treponema sp.]
MTIFDVDNGYWIGMGILVAVTIAYIIVCWAIPPKKKKESEAVIVSNE